LVGCIRGDASLAEDGDGGLPKKDFKRIQDDIKTIRKLIDLLKKVGIGPPTYLVKKLNALETALAAAGHVGEAMDDVKQALDEYRQNILDACTATKGEDAEVCDAEMTRQWQNRVIKFEFDINEESSVFSKSEQTTLARYAPKQVCKRWDYCAKEMKKVE
jgi:phosphoglycolate phosphatase-like HAD superfamily hydrolase